jgi:hypothetical protein
MRRLTAWVLTFAPASSPSRQRGADTRQRD